MEVEKPFWRPTIASCIVLHTHCPSRGMLVCFAENRFFSLSWVGHPGRRGVPANPPPPPKTPPLRGCIRREGALEAAPEAVRQAVRGGCQSGWGRLLLVTNAVEAGTWRQGDSDWAQASPWRGGGGDPPPFQSLPAPLPPFQYFPGEISVKQVAPHPILPCGVWRMAVAGTSGQALMLRGFGGCFGL